MEEKLVRICWNTNSWTKPSGPEGKSKNKKAYEEIVGYGHEEWLFDLEKIIDGYHYGFLQAAHSGRDIHKDKIYNINLYTINSSTGTRWWVGSIKNVQWVHVDESKNIYKEYKNRGWFEEMLRHLKNVDASVEDFANIDPSIFVTVKFHSNDVELETPPKQFNADDPAINATYYNLQPYNGKPSFTTSSFNFVAGHNPGKTRGWVIYADHKTEKDLLHNQIQNSTYLQFTKQFGNENVGTEQLTENGTKIDIVVRNENEKFTFYEIKTSSSLIGSIREALSQLLEYAYYPAKEEASKLVVISPNNITTEVLDYLKHLRSKFNLPIYYQVFDQSKMKLNEELY